MDKGKIKNKNANVLLTADNILYEGGGRTLDKLLDLTYPVGSIYISVASTNPSQLFGGTWSLFGAGRTLVCVNSSDAVLNASNKTGGSTNPLTAHDHPADDSAAGGHSHEVFVNGDGNFPLITYPGWSGGNSGQGTSVQNSYNGFRTYTNSAGTHDHNIYIYSRGDNTNHNNWQPFITAYIWQRTA